MKETGFVNAWNAIARSKRAAGDRFACRCIAARWSASTVAPTDSASFSCTRLAVPSLAPFCVMVFVALLLCWVVFLSPQVAYAETASLQAQSQSQPLSLTVHCVHDDVNVPGVRVSAYRVATAGEGGALQPVAPFDAYPVLWSASSVDEARALAITLEGLVLRDGVAPTDEAITNTNGIAVFPTSGEALEPGAYLVMGQAIEHAGALYVPQPMLITLPLQNDDGTLDFAPVVRMKNESLPVGGKTSLDVTKVWADATNTALNRPDSITVQLLRDGQVVQTAQLSDANGWHVLFGNLPNEYRWSIVEAEVPEGFVTSVSQQGTSATITNTRTTPEEPPVTPDNPGGSDNPGGKLPQTGQLWWPVPLLVVAGGVFVTIGVLRSRKD